MGASILNLACVEWAAWETLVPELAWDHRTLTALDLSGRFVRWRCPLSAMALSNSGFQGALREIVD